jgi:peptidoglycan/xylan/chitin deacetylase (PgdA/CDA1 family)
MKTMKAVVIALITVIFLSNADAAVILIYHKIGDNRTPTTNVSTELFKQQMKYLKDNQFRVISLSKLISLMKNKKPIPKKSIVITFDDGYKTVYTNAFPTIKKYGYPACVFLPTEAIERHYPDYMNLSQIKQMRKFGIDFQSHSYSHPRMAYKPKNISEKEYENFLTSQLIKSKAFFEKYLGYAPTMFAIPYGEYNKTVINIAIKSGFSAIFTQDTGAVSNKTPLWLIPREPILGTYWSTMKHFKYVVNNEEYLPIKNRYPDIGTYKTIPKKIKAEITDISRYKDFKIYTSDNGWQKAKVKNNTIYLDNISVSKTRKKLHIGVYAIDKKTKKDAKIFWMIVLKH